LLRRLAAGEDVSNQVDWPHVVEEIEDLGHGRGDQDEVARLTALLAAAEARVEELRARLVDPTGKLADTQAELANARSQVDTVTVRAVAAVEAEQGVRRADGPGRRGAAGRSSGLPWRPWTKRTAIPARGGPPCSIGGWPGASHHSPTRPPAMGLGSPRHQS
jgi:hypothetical protein